MNGRESLLAVLTVLLLGCLLSFASPAAAGADESFESAQSGTVTLEFEPTDGTVVRDNGTATYDIVVNHTGGTDAGISSYSNLNVTVTDTTLATIVDWEVLGDVSLSTSEILDGGARLRLEAALESGTFDQPQGNYTIATVTVQRADPDSQRLPAATGLGFGPTAGSDVLDNSSESYAIDEAGFENATVTVAALDRVELSPAVDRTITPGETVSFGAAAFDEFDDLVTDEDGQFTWDAEGGSIDATGVFDETTPGTYNVTATLDGVPSGTTAVTVEQADVVTLELRPTNLTVARGGGTTTVDVVVNQTFGTDSGLSTYNGVNLTVEDPTVAEFLDWELQGGVLLSQSEILDGGARLTLEATLEDGTFDQPQGNYTIATATVGGSGVDEGSVPVTTAIGFGPTGNTRLIDDDSDGYVLDERAVQNGSVTVSSVDRVELDPEPNRTVVAGEPVTFDAAAFDANGTVIESDDSAFAWDAEGGSITTAGTFEETTAGTYNVTAALGNTSSNATRVTVQPPNVTIDPSPTRTVSVGETVAFSAAALNASNAVVEDDDSAFAWDAEGASITGAGLFEASATGSYDVTAAFGGGTSNATTVTVQPPNVTIDPSPNRTITAGETVAFSATARATDDSVVESTDSNFSWNAAGASITGDGLFDETTAGTYTVTATFGGGTSPATNVTVQAAATDRVELSPATNRTVTAGGSVEFGARAFDAFDNPVADDNSTFSWDAEGGSITTAGLFDETTAGSYNVTATFDGVTADATRVTVEPGPAVRVTLEPGADQTITAGEEVAFDATAFDAEDNVAESVDGNFSWDAETGSIGTAGLFDETATGTYNVTATLEGVVSNGTAVTVEPASIVTVELEPTDVTLLANGGRATVDVVVNHTARDNRGLGTYSDIDVVVDPTVAEIVDWEVRGNDSIDDSKLLDGGARLRLGAATGDDFDTARPNYTIATMTVEGATIDDGGLPASTGLGVDPAANTQITDSEFTPYVVDETAFQNTSVTVEGASGVDSVEIRPESDRTITNLSTVSFSATAFDGTGSVVTDQDSVFTWDAEGGSITDEGLFDESTPGTYNVTATLDGTTSNETTVTVEPATVETVLVEPATNRTIREGDTLAFSATALDSDGNVVESNDSAFAWSAGSGSIDTTGLFDGTATGSYDVEASLDGVTSNATTVTVEPPGTVTAELVPNDETVQANGTTTLDIVLNHTAGFNGGVGGYSDVNVTVADSAVAEIVDWQTVDSGVDGSVLLDNGTLLSLEAVVDGNSGLLNAQAEYRIATVTVAGADLGASGLPVSTELGFDPAAGTGVVDRNGATYLVDETGAQNASVTVVGDVERVSITPTAGQTITAGESVAFSATAFDGEDNVVEDDDSRFTWATEGGVTSADGLFEETRPGTYNVTATLDGVTSNATRVTVEPGDAAFGLDIELNGTSVDAILAGEQADVVANVTNAAGTARNFELRLGFETPGGTAIGGFGTVNSSELAPGESELVRFENVTGGLGTLGLYDVTVSLDSANGRYTVPDAVAVSVDVDGNGEPAADAAGGPERFDGLLDSVSGQSNDRLSVVDVVALFENIDEPAVQNNPELFSFERPDAESPDVGIADIVALFRAV
jgi:hypothetical protein